MAKVIELNLNKCLNLNRVFYLQPTEGTQFSVNLLNSDDLTPGCSAF